MQVGLMLRGLAIGLSIAAPVGPIGVLCIRRTLAQGRAAGLASGLGAATADAVYGSIAAFGLTWASDLLLRQQAWLRLAGGAFLCYLGLRTLLARPAEPAVPAEQRRDGPQNGPAALKGRALLGAYLSTFLLTLTNPITILSFAAIFAGLGLASAGRDYLSAATLVLGVFLGSAAWWLLLSAGVGALRERIGGAALGQPHLGGDRAGVRGAGPAERDHYAGGRGCARDRRATSSSPSRSSVSMKPRLWYRRLAGLSGE